MNSLRPRDWRVAHAQLSAFLAERIPYPRIFATLSGADLYGFPSDDGDFDLRACHVLPVRHVLVAMLNEGGFDRMKGATIEGKAASPHIDLVSHDIAKFLRLALKGNGYVLEQLSSPLVVETSEWHAELKALAKRIICRRLYFHYRGFFTNEEKLYGRSADKPVKGLLYQYRVAMTGIVALETGEIEANLPRLNQRFGLAGVDELIARKVAGEFAGLEDDAPYLAEIGSLSPRLDAAHERSRLPEIPALETRLAVEDFLIRCRQQDWGGL